jgi:hypothetical protein
MPRAVTERRLHLHEHPVAPDAAAAEGNQHPGVGRDVRVECGNLAFAKNDSCRVMKRKVLH